MKKSAIDVMRAAVLAVLAPAAIAAPADFTDHGSYLTDTISQLDWLDLSATIGLSFNDVSAGLSGGWRHATATEFNDLINHYTDIIHYGPLYSYDTNTLDGLVDLLGTTYAQSDVRNAAGILVTIPGSTPGLGIASITDWFTADVDAYYIAGIGTNADLSNEVWGSYLVRDSSPTVVRQPVPEPETYALMLAGLGLLGLARRARNNRV